MKVLVVAGGFYLRLKLGCEPFIILDHGQYDAPGFRIRHALGHDPQFLGIAEILVDFFSFPAAGQHAPSQPPGRRRLAICQGSGKPSD